MPRKWHPERLALATRIARMSKDDPDNPALDDLKRQHRMVVMREHIAKYVNGNPPLDAAQRAELCNQIASVQSTQVAALTDRQSSIDHIAHLQSDR